MSLLHSRARSTSAMSRLGCERLDQALLDVEQSEGIEPSALRSLWESLSPERSLVVLSSLIKADLRGRFARGDQPQVAAYLDEFGILKSSSDRVVSLVYEEYCLLRERGEAADPEEFCHRYEPWRDSLMVQLECHELLSQASGRAPSIDLLPEPGDRFRSFHLRELLGQGGSARVFLAHDESLGDRPVALKVSTDRGTEAWIQGRLDHAHIVPVLSVVDDTESGLRALCMPYRAGLTLDEVILRVNPPSRPSSASVLRDAIAACDVSDEDQDLDKDQDRARQTSGWHGFPSRGTYAEGVAWIGSVVADALHYAHRRKILHRDVKPANVLLTVRDGPQLLDFNLAHTPHSADHAQSALRGGTLPYMAPEQLEAFLDAARWNHVNEPAEVYSLGLLLRELLTGRRPEAPDPKLPLTRAIRDLLDHRMADVPPDPQSDPDVPAPLQTILKRCLAPRPADRYESAAALADALREFVARRRRLRNRIVSVVAATVLVTLFAAAGAVYLRQIAPQRAQALVTSVRSRFNPKSKLPIPPEVIAASLKDINHALAADPNSFEAYEIRSFLRGKLGQWELVLADSEEALRLLCLEATPSAETVTKLLLQKGSALLNLKRYQDTIRVYETVLQIEPDHTWAHSYLAQAAHEIKDFRREIKALTDAIAWGKNNTKTYLIAPTLELVAWRERRAAAHIGLGSRFQNDGQPESFRRAEEEYRLAEEDLRAADALIRDSLATTGNVREMNEEVKWLQLSANLKIVMGDVASAHNDYPSSLDAYRKSHDFSRAALSRNPINPESQRLFKKANDRRKNDWSVYLGGPWRPKPPQANS